MNDLVIFLRENNNPHRQGEEAQILERKRILSVLLEQQAVTHDQVRELSHTNQVVLMELSAVQRQHIATALNDRGIENECTDLPRSEKPSNGSHPKITQLHAAPAKIHDLHRKHPHP